MGATHGTTNLCSAMHPTGSAANAATTCAIYSVCSQHKPKFQDTRQALDTKPIVKTRLWLPGTHRARTAHFFLWMHPYHGLEDAPLPHGSMRTQKCRYQDENGSINTNTIPRARTVRSLYTRWFVGQHQSRDRHFCLHSIFRVRGCLPRTCSRLPSRSKNYRGDGGYRTRRSTSTSTSLFLNNRNRHRRNRTVQLGSLASLLCPSARE